MAAKFERGEAGSLSSSFRPWPVLSNTTSIRRKLLEAVICGGISRHHRGKSYPVECVSPSESKRSEKLSELLKAEASESISADVEEETRNKIQVLDELQSVVKKLEFEDSRRKEAAIHTRRLAKGNADARATLAKLGAIPPLVGMLDADDSDEKVASLYALLNLGIGNNMNKAAIVAAGAIYKMMKLVGSGCSDSVSEAVVANFLGLSALDANKPIIGASGAVAFLVKTFRSSKQRQAKSDSLRSLFNLSISSSNVCFLIESELVPCIFAAIGDMEYSGRVLSLLSNLVTDPEGMRAVSRSPDAIPILVDVLSWSDSPECQEKAAYVLMVMAHNSPYKDRAAMTESGIRSSLLELTLIGSPLAQKRASRILHILNKGKQTVTTSPVSAPSVSGEHYEDGDDAEAMSEENRAVKQLVQLSLHNNMRRIARRANLPQDFDFAHSDGFRTVAGTSSTSKSLPF